MPFGMKLSVSEGPVDYAAARKFALVAAGLKFMCTILLVIIIAINNTRAGYDAVCLKRWALGLMIFNGWAHGLMMMFR